MKARFGEMPACANLANSQKPQQIAENLTAWWISCASPLLTHCGCSIASISCGLLSPFRVVRVLRGSHFHSSFPSFVYVGSASD